MVALGSISRQALVGFIAAAVVVAAIIIVVVPIFVTYQNASAGKVPLELANDLNPSQAGALFNFLDFPVNNTAIVLLTASSVDPAGSAMKLRAVVGLSYDLTTDAFKNRAKADINLSVNSQVYKIAKGNSLPVTEFTVPIYGSIDQYPRDQYSGFLEIQAFVAATNQPLNVTSFFVTGIQNFQIDDNPVVVFGEFTDPYTFYSETSFTIKRAITVRGFSIFIIILMWIIVLLNTFITIDSIARNREIGLPNIGANTGLLFALPNVRNTQPGVPPIGTSGDIGGFFWNIVLIAICLIINMTLYIFKYVPKKPEAKKDEPKKEQKDQGPDVLISMTSIAPLTPVDAEIRK